MSLWRNVGRSLLVREEHAIIAQTRIAGFDLNDTLVSSKIGAPGYQVTLSDWCYYNDAVPTKLRKLHEDGFKLVIFTNQGNIRAALEGKRAQSVRAYIDAALKDLGVPVQVFVATQRDNYRKPSVGMWEFLEQKANNGVIVDRSRSFYVGDAAGGLGEHSSDDLDFAKAVGVSFVHVCDYFGPRESSRSEKRPFPADAASPSKVLRTLPDHTIAASSSSLLTFASNGRPNPPVVLVLVGAPGSGKTTFAERLGPPASSSGGSSVGSDSSPWRRVCQDLLRSKDACLRVADACLDQGLSVIIDRTNVDPAQRATWLELAAAKGATCHCLALNVPLQECCRRVQQRTQHEGGLNGGGASSGVVMRLFGQLCPVTSDEKFSRVAEAKTTEELDMEVKRYSNLLDSVNSCFSANAKVDEIPALNAVHMTNKSEGEATSIQTSKAGLASLTVSLARASDVGSKTEASSLIDLGFSREACEEALYKASNDKQLAIDYLLSGSSCATSKTVVIDVAENDCNTCTKTERGSDSSKTTSGLLTSEIPQSHICSLMALGFTLEACEEALKETKGDHQLAADRLCRKSSSIGAESTLENASKSGPSSEKALSGLAALPDRKVSCEIESLMALGFSRQACEAALASARGDKNAAANDLLTDRFFGGDL